jgi:hypothetical protein
VAAGMASSLTASTVGAADASSTKGKNAMSLENPLAKYPKPPFEGQPQPYCRVGVVVYQFGRVGVVVYQLSFDTRCFVELITVCDEFGRETGDAVWKLNPPLDGLVLLFRTFAVVAVLAFKFGSGRESCQRRLEFGVPLR